MRCAPVLALLVVGCSDTHTPPALPLQPPPNQLRVMSYNVNFGIADDRATIDAIEAAHADIVLLQETNSRWQHALIDRLYTRYAHVRFTDPTDWPAGGMGLLSKYPIVAHDQLDGGGGPFFAWRVVLDTKLGRIQILSVHLRPPMSDGGSWVVGY